MPLAEVNERHAVAGAGRQQRQLDRSAPALDQMERV